MLIPLAGTFEGTCPSCRKTTLIAATSGIHASTMSEVISARVARSIPHGPGAIQLNRFAIRFSRYLYFDGSCTISAAVGHLEVLCTAAYRVTESIDINFKIAQLSRPACLCD